MVATLERHKDHATLLRAVPTILEQRPGFRLRLIGDGSLRMDLEYLTHTLGIADVVEFFGTRRDVAELLGKADLFVFSTTAQEGLGTVLVEALAAGLPVVASDVPACRELLRDGEFGQLVLPADPGALAKAVIVSASGVSPEALAKRDRYLAQFSAARMIEQYLSLVGLGPTPLPSRL
jgi:glycosyltransferase involved in cell wall biosynthesis